MTAETWPTISDPWIAAGTEPVLLPSGVAVLWEPTTVAQLMVRGILPGYLRSMALQFAGDGVDYSKLPPDDQGRFRELCAMTIIESVRGAAMLGDPEFQIPFRLTPEQVNDENPRMPRPDLEALQHLVLHLRTPGEVTATSRLVALERDYRKAVENGADADTLAELRRQQAESAARYQRTIEREAVGGIAGWISFRDDRRGADPGAERAGVGSPAVGARDHLGPGGRVRARRRPADPSRPSRRRSRSSAES